MDRFHKNEVYQSSNNVTLMKNPIYIDPNSVNNYNTLNRNNYTKVSFNNNYSRLNTFHSNDTIYSTLDENYLKNETKYKLPDDWVELYDEETDKKYYACLTTKHTQWLHPSIPIGTMMDNGLPYGWDYKIDPRTNEKYFINHVGRFTTWKPPVKQRKYKGKDYMWEVNL